MPPITVMDYPTYPGTDRTMRLGDPVAMTGGILGTIRGVELRFDGQAVVVIVDGPEDSFRAHPKDLAYWPKAVGLVR
ncbi:MAG TPA: hypothetical protein VF228_17335 [Iamia sp.]